LAKDVRQKSTSSNLKQHGNLPELLMVLTRFMFYKRSDCISCWVTLWIKEICLSCCLEGGNAAHGHTRLLLLKEVTAHGVNVSGISAVK
jgi:hypothetical protein